MKSIRREISQIVGVLIPKDGWEQTFKELQGQGRISPKQLVEILLVILKKLEAQESV